MNKSREDLFKAIDIIVKERLKELRIPYFQDGVIKTVNPDATYTVTMSGEDYTLKATEGNTFVVGDIVDVIVKNGDNSRKFIVWKRVL